MPSAQVEQIRQQFYASLGINENTPISDADAPQLIDQWEQYLYSYAARGNVGTSYPGYPGTAGYPGTFGGTPRYVPPQIRTAPGYQGTGGPGSVYVSPPGGGPAMGGPPPYPNSGIAPPAVRPGVRIAPPVRR